MVSVAGQSTRCGRVDESFNGRRRKMLKPDAETLASAMHYYENMNDARDNKATETQAYNALRIAQIHAETTTKPMKSSAQSCVKDAEEFFNKGMFGYAHSWAIQSLRYSVGILHPDFAKTRNG